MKLLSIAATIGNSVKLFDSFTGSVARITGPVVVVEDVTGNSGMGRGVCGLFGRIGGRGVCTAASIPTPDIVLKRSRAIDLVSLQQRINCTSEIITS